MKYFINILAVLTAIAMLIQISSLKFNLGNSYYGILICVFVLQLLTGKHYQFNYLMVCLLLAGFLSIILNDIPAFFRPYERFISFILVMGLTGPLVRNTTLQKFRLKLFITINVILVTMVIISFLGIATGLSIMLGRGGFAGLFSHSMILGPMAAIAMLISINWSYNSTKRKNKWAYSGLGILAFLTCVAAGSRGGLIAGIAGSLFYYYKINQGKLNRFIQIVLIISAIGIFSFPLWETYTERMMEKMAYSKQENDVLVTRSFLWKTRITEFISSPVVGVGFAAVDTDISTKFDETEGHVEPGSSWLAILSMTGLLGFLPMILLTLTYIRYVFRDKANPQNVAFLGGMLFLFIVHMMVEGYVFSAGSGLFFYFWLVMGLMEQNKKRITKLEVIEI